MYLNVLTCNYDIIVLSETWLASDILDSELFCDRYLVYRRDRESSGFHNNKSGGGVLVAVSKRLRSYRVTKWESKCEDVYVCVDICLNKRPSKLLICAVYIPPPVQKHILEHFIDNTNNALENFNATLILGDFNMSSIEWIGSPGAPLTSSLNKNGIYEQKLLDFISLNSLAQYNCMYNHKGKILDLVLTDTAVKSVGVSDSPLSNIDLYHPPLEFELLCNLHEETLSPNQEPKFKFYKADYSKIIQELSEISWQDLFTHCGDVDTMVDSFYKVIYGVIEKYVQKKKPGTCKYPVWFSRDLVRLLQEKNKYRTLYSKFKNPLDKISYRLLKDRVSRLTHINYRQYIKSIESSITSNPS